MMENNPIIKTSLSTKSRSGLFLMWFAGVGGTYILREGHDCLVTRWKKSMFLEIQVCEGVRVQE